MFFFVHLAFLFTFRRSLSPRVTSLVLFFSILLLATFIFSTKPALAINHNREESSSLARSRVAKSFMNEGFAQARILFKEALSERPDDTELRDYIASAIAVIAFREYEDGRYNKARDLFKEALELKENLEFHKGLAMCLLKMGNIKGALGILTPLREDVQVGRYLVDLYSALGEKYYLEGDLERALHNFILGAELDYTNKYVFGRLKVLTGEYKAEIDFRTKEGSHFLVKYDAGENAVLGNLVSILLEEAYLRMGYDFGYYPEDRIEAVLYTKEQFRDITKSPSWAGAIYDGRIKIPVGGITERTDLLEGVLFHEFSHAVVHRVAKGTAPMWLNEGLAQYVEGKRISERQGAYLKEIIGDNRFSLRNLEGSFMRLSPKEAHKAYLMSLSATEYIITEFGSFTAFSILESLGSGENIDSAVSASVFLTYEELIDSWLNSVRR